MDQTFRIKKWPKVKKWIFDDRNRIGIRKDILGFSTRAIHSGFNPLEDAGKFRSFLPPIVQSITFPYERFETFPEFVYGRSQNPTVQVLEERLASLEGGEAALTSCSGSQSLFNLILTLVKPGDNVVASLNIFGEGYQQAREVFPVHCGVDFHFVKDPSDPDCWERAISGRTRLVWVETPSNPCLYITDIHSVAEIAHAHHVPLLVDNTIATPALQQPLAHGADIVLHSISKFICGNASLLGGAIIGPKDLIEDVRMNTNEYIGAILQPFDAWLTLMFVETLNLRMERHSKNAQEVAEFLTTHPRVLKVNYPGLKSHLGHEVAVRQMKAFSGMLSFEVEGGLQGAAQVMNSIKLIVRAVTLGTSKSLCMHPASITHVDMTSEERDSVGIGDGLLRLSVGLEDSQDIIADLEQALG